jgi:hypothetical protein
MVKTSKMRLKNGYYFSIPQKQKRQNPPYMKFCLYTEWLPIVDDVRTFFESLSEEIADTIVAVQGGMAA